MKITWVKGSPRSNGNSAQMAAAFFDEVKKAGDVQVKTFELNRMNYKGCQECLKCNTDIEKCAINDDLAEVLDEIQTSDVLVLSSSVFYGEVTSQAKGLIDRMYSFAKYDFDTMEFTLRLERGKRLVMVLSQGNPDEKMFADIFPRYNYFFTEFLGFSDNRLIRACGLLPFGEPGEDILEQARETARSIMATN